MKLKRRRNDGWHESVASRPWSRAERRVVLRGFLGRFLIAIEPLAVAAFFSLLPIGLLLRKQETALILAPIFGLAALLFLAYAIFLMVPSTHALLETLSPIYIIDGYIRYRRSNSDTELPYHVAVLDSERKTLGEWPLREWPHSIGEHDIWPAMVEFSEFGGIHCIDGRPTGVLPAEIAPLGIGIAQQAATRGETRFR
ncbi:MAG: hypothetical protein ACLPYS_18460 [Vulcanimicrobiaceae bacterium]